MQDKLCSIVFPYRYDKMNRITEESHRGEAVCYSCDLCENLLEKVDKNEKEVYTYNVDSYSLFNRKTESEWRIIGHHEGYF